MRFTTLHVLYFHLWKNGKRKNNNYFFYRDLRLKLLVDTFFTTLEKYEAMSEMALEKLKEFSVQYLKNLYIKVLVQGNVSSKQAIAVVDKFINTIKCEEIPEGTYPVFRVHELPIGTNCCQVENFNKSDSNTIVNIYYQVGSYNLQDNVIIELLMILIDEPLFDTLRTKEQLGYSVSCALRDTYSILGFTIKVNSQATKFTPKYVDDRIHEFVRSFTVTLENMTELEFDEIKIDLIKKKECIDIHLRDEVSRNWVEIVDDEYKFDRLKQEVEAIKKLKVEDVKQFWRLYTGLTQTRKLCVRVVGFNTKEKPDNDNKEDLAIKYLKVGEDDWPFIANLNEFKQTMKFYPCIRKR